MKLKKKWTAAEWSLFVLPLVTVIGFYVLTVERQALNHAIGLRLTGARTQLATVQWSPDGHLLVASGEQWSTGRTSPGELLMWDARTGELLHRLDGHTSRAFGMRFSGDGRYLATSSYREVIVWDVAQGVEKWRWRLAVPTLKSWDAADRLTVSNFRIKASSIALLAQTSVLDATTGAIISQRPASPAKPHTRDLVSPNGRYLLRHTPRGWLQPLLAERDGNGHSTGGELQVWGYRPSTLVHSVPGRSFVDSWWDKHNRLQGIATVKIGGSSVSSVAYSFDPVTKKEEWTEFWPHPSSNEMATPDHRYYYFNGDDGRIHVFDIASLREPLSWKSTTSTFPLQFSPSNNQVAAADGSLVVIRDLPKLTP